MEKLNVGFGRVDITPDFPVSIAGYSDDETRISEGVLEHIYVTCIAMTAGAETVLLYTIDNLSVYRKEADIIREYVSPKVGVAPEKIFFTATHCHTAPTNYLINDGAKRYRALLLDWMTQAAQEALADRVPAEIYGAKHDLLNLNFVRHYLLDDGSLSGSNFGSSKGRTVVGHAAETDPQMMLVKFAREGKTDVLLTNWQAHPDRSREMGYTLISPSWIGPMRRKLEKKTGMLVAYIGGASGDEVTESKVPGERLGYTWIEYGEKVAEGTLEAIEKLQPIAGEGIQTTRALAEAEINHTWDDKIEQANEVYDLWKSVGKKEGDELGRKYDFTSSYQARAIRTRYNMGKTDELELNAFRVGGIGFVTNTYEMFCGSGRFVKDNSPFDITLVCCGNSSYIPTISAYQYRCYEADTGYFAPGTAEILAQKLVDMLGEVK